MTKLLRNPFYAIAMVLGLLFTLTACAEGVLMLKSNRDGALPRQGESGYDLMNLLDQHGTEVFVVELAALGCFTVAAIRLDVVRDRREFAKKQQGAGEQGSGERGQGSPRR
jgi:hypothetical protein